MECEAVQSKELLQVGIDREVEPVLVDRALFCAAGRVTKNFPDVGDRKLDALLLVRIGQKAKGRFLYRALACIGIGGLQVIRFIVLQRGSLGAQEHE